MIMNVYVFVYLHLDSLCSSSDQEFEIIKRNLLQIDISTQNGRFMISTHSQQNTRNTPFEIGY